MTQADLFHGSPSEDLSEITASGVFGGLFASVNESAARSHGEHMFAVMSPRPLSDYELNYEIAGAFDAAVKIAGSVERAEKIMNIDCPDEDEEGWELQRLRGKLAAKLGYTSVEMRDEHGTTWLCLPGCTLERVR